MPCVSAMLNCDFTKDELRELCKNSPRYNAKKFDTEIDSLDDPNFDISVLIGKTKLFAPNFDITSYKRQWYKEHADFNKNYSTSKSNLDSLKSQPHYDETDDANELNMLYELLRKVNKEIADFESEKEVAIEKVKSAETFDKDSVFANDILIAAAFAKIYDKKTFSDFKDAIQIYIKTTKSTSFICEKAIETDAEIHKLTLTYLNGKWQKLLAHAKKLSLIRVN